MVFVLFCSTFVLNFKTNIMIRRRVDKVSEDGKILQTFESITEAAIHMGCDESFIRKRLDHPYKMLWGYYFKTSGKQLQKFAKDYTQPNQYNTKVEKSLNTKNVKVLLLDIEIAPLLAFVWKNSIWKTNIKHENVFSDWFILTYSCKWLGDKYIMSGRLTSTEAICENDERIVKELWSILEQTDIVIAHNGDCFDIPNINTRFMVHGLTPPATYKQIDTMKVAKKQFGFTHNSLQAIATALGLEGKIETTFQLWKDCLFGKEAALKEMEKYNKNDVVVLENVYYKLRPWIKSHQNISLFNEEKEMQCAHCGSKDLYPYNYYYTNTGKYKTYKCKECGAISRERKTSISRQKEVLVSIPGR